MGIMEKKLETSVFGYLGFRVWGFGLGGLGFSVFLFLWRVMRSRI